MTTMEERMSRLEGIIEGAIPHINQRLGSLEQGQADIRREMSGQSTQIRGEMTNQFTEIRREMNSQFTEIHRELRSQFRWFIGTLLGVGAAILTAVLTTQIQ